MVTATRRRFMGPAIARTRNKLQPLVPVGVPMPQIAPPQMRVPEPAALVGLQTGQVHAVVGDNPNGPETMTVSPPPAPGAAPLTPGPNDITLGREFSQLGGSSRPMSSPVSMAGGGTATVGPDGTVASSYDSGQGNDTPYFDNAYYQQLRASQRQATGQSLADQGGVLGAESNYLGSQYTQLGAREATLPSQYAALQARQATIPAQAGVLQAQAGTFGPRTALTNAQRAVLGQRAQSLALQRQATQQEQTYNTQGLQDLQTLIGARTNVADQTAVAQESQRRGVENQDYAKLGVSAPVDVLTAPGAEGSVAPGTRATLQTQENIVQQRNADNAATRANLLRQAQLAVQMQDTNVTEASNAAQAAGLTLDEANQMVDQARNQAGFSQLNATAAGYGADAAQLGATAAGYATDEAGLGVTAARNQSSLTDLQGRVIQNDITNLSSPTDQGYELYTDPATGQKEWLLPGEADRRGLLTQRQNRLNVDQSVIPQEYQYQQQNRAYTTQQNAGGSPLGYLSDADLLNTLPNNGGTSADYARVASELARRAIQNGATPQQAQKYADDRIKNELASRPRTGSGGYAFGTPPAGTAPAPGTGNPPVTSSNGFTFHP